MKKKLLLSLLCILQILFALQAQNTQRNIAYTDDNVRFTVISDGALRLEYAPDGKFVDSKSHIAINRLYPQTDYKLKTRGGWVEITTSKMKMRYKKNSGQFTDKNLIITAAKEMLPFSWKPGMQQKGNLKGTYRTLDGMDGDTQTQTWVADTKKGDKLKLEDGLLATDGWTFIDDSQGLLFDDDKDWDWKTFGSGKGFFADFIVAGTMLADRIRGGVLQSMDGSLEIDLRESSKGMQFKRNGKKAIDIEGTKIKFFDWDGEGDAVAHIYSTRIGGDENKLGLAIANKKDRSISISYESGDTYYSYMRFDMDNSDKTTNSPITIFKETDFRGSQIWFGYDINSIYNSTNNNLIAKVQNEFKVADRANGKSRFRVLQDWIAAYDKDSCYFEAGKLKSDGKGYFIFRDGQTAYLYRVAGQEKVWCDYNLTVDKKLHVNGDLAVVGNKNCIQPTENYGDRLFYSVEDAESYLTDRSMEVFTVEKTAEGTYERVILLDNIFKEAVRVDNNYTVEVIKQGWGDYRVKEQNENYFVVEADRKDFTFKYVVTAKRRGFEDIRLVEYHKVENDIEVMNVEGDLATNLDENEICEELNI